MRRCHLTSRRCPPKGLQHGDVLPLVPSQSLRCSADPGASTPLRFKRVHIVCAQVEFCAYHFACGLVVEIGAAGARTHASLLFLPGNDLATGGLDAICLGTTRGVGVVVHHVRAFLCEGVSTQEFARLTYLHLEATRSLAQARSGHTVALAWTG